MATTLENAVAVVTGASSGIGRATALALAREGASVVASARRADALNRLVIEIEAFGGHALAVPADVTSHLDIEALANRAVEAFGHIDIWVNDAAVMSFGRFVDTPREVFERVIETNVIGYANGARAVLPHFRSRRSGTLVNVASVVSRVPQPHAAAYVASKHAIRSLGMNLRQELELDGFDDIHVVTVMPASIDTPLFGHAANFTGKQVQPPPPVYPPEEVAKTILAGIHDPKPELFAGCAGHAFNLSMKLAPHLTEKLAAGMAVAQESGDGHVAPSEGNLFEPSSDEAQVSGGWLQRHPSRSARIASAGFAVIGISIAAWLVRRRTMRS